MSGVLFDERNRVLLIRRSSPPAEGLWSIPGGVVLIGEQLEQALRRELLEECGIRAGVGPLLGASSRIVTDAGGRIRYHYVLLDYLCHWRGGRLKAGSDASDARWVELHTLASFELTEGISEIIRAGWEKRGER